MAHDVRDLYDEVVRSEQADHDPQVVPEERDVLYPGFELVVVEPGFGRQPHPFGADGERGQVSDFRRCHPEGLDQRLSDPDFANGAVQPLDGAGKPVVFADEAGHEVPHRFLVEVLRAGDLLQAAVVEHRHPVREHHRLLLVVGDVDAGDPERPLDPANLVLHFLAEPPIEGAERLVHEHEVRLEDEGAGDGYPLLLTPGELGGLAVLVPLEANQGEGARHPLPADLRVHSAHFEREGQVLPHRQVREEGVVLEHHPDAAFTRRQIADRAAADPDGAGGWRFEPGQHHQASGLAGPRGSEQGEELALPDLEVEPGHHRGHSVVGLRDSLELDVGGIVRCHERLLTCAVLPRATITHGCPLPMSGRNPRLP